jgi:hypothetical protein
VTDAAKPLRALLAEALALADSDAAEAERRAKAVSALVRATRDVAELEAATGASSWEDEEAKRAELRRRIAVFAQADLDDAPAGVVEWLGRGNPAV